MESASGEKEEILGEAKKITAKTEVICVHSETDKYDLLNWQALLAC